MAWYCLGCFPLTILPSFFLFSLHDGILSFTLLGLSTVLYYYHAMLSLCIVRLYRVRGAGYDATQSLILLYLVQDGIELDFIGFGLENGRIGYEKRDAGWLWSDYG